MRKVISVHSPQRLLFAISIAFTLGVSVPLSASPQVCSSIFQTPGPRLTEAQASHKKQFETVIEPLYKSRWSIEFRNNNEFSDTVFIFADPTEGREKIVILQKLGFKFSKDVTEAPNFSKFLQNYQVLLDKAQIPKHRRILPALAFGKKVDGVLQFQLVTPGVDPWPTDPGMILLDSAQIFNLPYETVLNGLKRGRFPLMNAAHDVFHFVGFVKDPNFMAIIRDAVAEIENPRPVKAFGLRINLLIELLTLAHPEKKSEIKKLFLAPKLFSFKADIEFAQFLSTFESLPKANLIAHAQILIESYATLLKDYGGAVNRSREKQSQITRFDVADLNMILYPEITVRDSERHFRETPANFNILLKDLVKIVEMSDIELTQYLNQYNFFQYRSRYPFLFKPGQDILNRTSTEVFEISSEARNFFKRHLALHLARMEYLVWRSLHDMSPARIVHGILRPDGSYDPEVADFLRDSFGPNSNFHQTLRPEGLTLRKK